ncbi:MAG: ATP-binding cassette subfamily F protein uup [Candidatus Krumholzibacteriia bacterium]|jgi:ATP-binding cassette subfamily F protein uup
MALIELKNLTLSLGGPLILDQVNLRIAERERICLVGRNGTGKSTLLRILVGTVKADSGELVVGKGLRVSMLPQEVPLNLTGTVHDIVLQGFADAQVAAPDWEHAHIVSQVLTRGELSGEDRFEDLSMGNKRRVLLARAMVVEPSVLLLDEPTNHLDIDAISWLEDELLRFNGTLIFVTHDRAFLRALATRIVELDRGQLRDWTCDYSTFLARRDEALRVEHEQRAEFDRKLAKEEAWMRQGVRDRRTRNEGRVRELKNLRSERSARREKSGGAKLLLQDVHRSGKLVARIKNLQFAWGEKIIADDFSTLIQRGDRIGVLGPNGSGKTTLLRLLLGDLEPNSGTVEMGTNLEVAYFDQQRDQLDESKTVLENITDGHDTVFFGGRTIHSVTYLKNFLFAPDRARSPITHLSGGERNRLLLARLFTRPANLLVLDEPTNDLDVETVELLEELVADFAGTLLLVSHDREFLDNVTTSTLVLEGDGQIAETVGGYRDWARASLKRRKEARKSGSAVPISTESDVVKKGSDSPKEGSAKGKARLSWKEQRELETLPDKIEALEAEQVAMHERMADPLFYQSDSREIAKLQEQLSLATDELATIYDRWSTLAERAE